MTVRIWKYRFISFSLLRDLEKHVIKGSCNFICGSHSQLTPTCQVWSPKALWYSRYVFSGWRARFLMLTDLLYFYFLWITWYTMLTHRTIHNNITFRKTFASVSNGITPILMTRILVNKRWSISKSLFSSLSKNSAKKEKNKKNKTIPKRKKQELRCTSIFSFLVYYFKYGLKA